MTELLRVLIAGTDGAVIDAVAARLRADGCVVATDPAGINEPGPWGVVVVAGPAPGGAFESIDIAAFIDRFDVEMNDAASAVRSLIGGGTLRRIVLVGSLCARGQTSASVPAAVGGGLTALARSWALEFTGEGITANTVLVADPHDDPVVLESLAEAAAFLLSPRAAAISGQVLSVSGDSGAGILPL